MWEFTLVKQKVIEVNAPKTSTGTANSFATEAKRQEPGGESFFSRRREKNSRSRAREKRRGGNGKHRPYSRKVIVEIGNTQLNVTSKLLREGSL